MKKGFLHKFAAVILVISMLLAVAAGCASPSSDKAQNDWLASSSFDINSMEYPFASEYPPIDEDMIFSDSAVGDSLTAMAVKKPQKEVRMVWISFLEMEKYLTNKTEAQFRKNVKTMFKNCKDFGINTLIIQVRPYADAFYKSDYFPWSFIITGTEGKSPGFDPFEIMVEEARARNLRIEAWINPYRIRPADRKNGLSKNNQARKWLEAGDDAVISHNGIISYNPASVKAQNLIVNGAVELVKNYDIDGIHIDDYFYPTMDKNFDKASYSAYTKSGGKLGLYDWRRANVEKILKKMYSAVKAVNKDLVFGISPQSSVYNNYNAHYLDVKKISSTKGYCDYICPQIYFGFKNAAQPYSETLAEWNKMVTASSGVKLYVGLAAYKVGTVDNWAGAGKDEWASSTTMLKRMTQEARKTKAYGGVGLYRYDFMFDPPAAQKAAAKKEVANLKELFK